MLILTRKNGESIKIGADTFIHILECTHRGVRIGIEAPKEINIVRTELLERDKEAA